MSHFCSRSCSPLLKDNTFSRSACDDDPHLQLGSHRSKEDSAIEPDCPEVISRLLDEELTQSLRSRQMLTARPRRARQLLLTVEAGFECRQEEYNGYKANLLRQGHVRAIDKAQNNIIESYNRATQIRNQIKDELNDTFESDSIF